MSLREIDMDPYFENINLFPEFTSSTEYIPIEEDLSRVPGNLSEIMTPEGPKHILNLTVHGVEEAIRRLHDSDKQVPEAA